jgi:membrane protein implicated in regulation of membrane protease activity
MDAWVLWVVAAVILAAGEVLTTSFFLGPFAVGAGAAARARAGVAAGAFAWAAFLIVSGVSLAVLRPVARRHLTAPPALRTGTAALVGQTATVVERIGADGEAGAVRLNGEVWTARTYAGDGEIEVGRRVHVLEIRGATALVTET